MHNLMISVSLLAQVNPGHIQPVIPLKGQILVILVSVVVQIHVPDNCFNGKR